jgi:ribosomal RNA assembly protein
MEEIIKVTIKRIPVLIGHNGITKRHIEKATHTRLDIDSHTGEIVIVGGNNYYDVYNAKKVVSAISRGFSPEVAFKILKDDYTIEVITLSDLAGKNESRLEQIKGRIIGREGSIKNMIERQFNCNISIFGKTVSIIAKAEDMAEVQKVVEAIIGGCKHTTVFKMLKSNKQLKNYKETEETAIDDIDFKE